MKRCINNDTIGTSDGGNDPLQRKLKNQTNYESSSELIYVFQLKFG